MVNWLATKWGLRSLSLLVAVLLWLVVYLDAASVLDITVPVKPVNVPPGLAIRAMPVNTITLRFIGPRVRLLFLDKVITSVRLDLHGVGEGETVFTNMGMMLKLPEDVHVNRTSPVSLKIILDRGQTSPLTHTVE